MKSLRDEIRLRRDNRTDLISSEAEGLRFHPSLLGFHRAKHDFIEIYCDLCYETEYWIEIAQKANIISKEIAMSILHDCGSIRRILIASINTAKENAK